jgi:hypothetical protein
MEANMNGTLTSLLFLEIALTAIFIAMWLWRSFLDMKEDDHLMLDQAEAHLQREQADIRTRVDTLSRYLKFAGAAWGLLAVAIVAGWFAAELNLI